MLRPRPNHRVCPGVVPAVKKLTPVASALVLAAALVATDVSAAQAEVVTCQSLPATIVGPTDGQATNGTEGDDVVADVRQQRVGALGGNDTVCLVDARAPRAATRSSP